MFPSIIRHRPIITAGKALLCALVLVTASLALPQTQARAASATSGASGVNVLVPATAQWVNTGISLNNGDQLGITATGSWSPGPTFGTVGPDGFTQPNADNFLNLQDIGSCASCASTPAPHFAGLIGYIGNAPPPPGSYTSTTILPEAQKVFFVGSNFGISIAVTGTLWLNFNDDAYSNNTGDNTGQATAAVTDTPSTKPLGGTWINPPNGFTNNTGNTLHFSAHAYGGVGGVKFVNFTIWWSAIGNNPWFVACPNVSNPTPGTTDVYECDWNLKDKNGHAVPNGAIKVGFDVYDHGGNRILSPNGVHSGTITTWTYDPGSYGGKSSSVTVVDYREPDGPKYYNYCGPGASQVLISAWTSNVPSIDTLATQEKTDQKNGTLMVNMVTPINNAIGQAYYTTSTANSLAVFSNMIGKDILNNGHPLITGLQTRDGHNHQLVGWNKVSAPHIITITGFDFTSPNQGWIYYTETASKGAGATAGPGSYRLDYNTFWALVQFNPNADIQLHGN